MVEVPLDGSRARIAHVFPFVHDRVSKETSRELQLAIAKTSHEDARVRFDTSVHNSVVLPLTDDQRKVAREESYELAGKFFAAQDVYWALLEPPRFQMLRQGIWSLITRPF
ncbi:MAG: hypothetical protein Q8Q49_04135 [bacterium]|nr:hypothetical protein [bacterium]